MAKKRVIFRAVNKITGELYVGKHTYEHESEWKNYFGSGRKILANIEEYGRENFSKVVLSKHLHSKTLEEMEVMQIKLHKELYGDKCLNILTRKSSGTSSGVWHQAHRSPHRCKHLSLDARQKQSHTLGKTPIMYKHTEENCLHEGRVFRDLTLKELGDMIGASGQWLSKIEVHKIRIGIKWKERIAAALGFDVGDVFPGSSWKSTSNVQTM